VPPGGRIFFRFPATEGLYRITMEDTESILQERLDEESKQKIDRLDNDRLNRFIAKYLSHCNPDSVFVSTDADEDARYIRNLSLEQGEEKQLAMEGHTAHFDGFHDQARDKENTKYLLRPDQDLGERLNSIDKETGLEEVQSYLENSMEGRQMLICFFCLGPQDSPFSIPAVQITDSPYVAHSEHILYRTGYEQFKNHEDQDEFFRFVHTEGRTEDCVSVDIDKRRVYIDLDNDIVYSTNTQYGGNTIGLKKLALRLAIQKASREGWLAEHMLVAGIHGPGDRVSYFTGAYPSACGKTSTAMLPGETVVGDDIAYLRDIDGDVRAANVESGIFGIIRDVNKDDDPLIWKALHEPGDVIFSNILVDEDGVPHWLGKGEELPDKGWNHSGEWWPGKTDEDGNEIPCSHRNARYTVRLENLDNCDEHLHDPKGVSVSGIIYGGRDSDTCVPVEQSFNWTHGVVTKGAALESETTAATLGEAGVRTFTPMSNMDFVSIPLGQYVQNHIDFGKKIDSAPPIFGVNYFLKDEDGEYLNAIPDKKVWMKWMDLRVHGEAEALRGPTGLIPVYEDLEQLFREHRSKNYSEEDYIEQFSIRLTKNLEKIDRIEETYRESVPDAPQVLFDELEKQRQRLEEWRAEYGDQVPPTELDPA